MAPGGCGILYGIDGGDLAVLVVDTLTTSHIAEARRRQYRVVIYRYLSSDVSLIQITDVNLISLYQGYQEMANRAYARISANLDRIKTKLPRLFKIDGTDLTYALQKDLFWGLLESELLSEHLQEFAGERVINRAKRNPLIAFAAFMKRAFFGSNRVYSLRLDGVDRSSIAGMAAVRVNSPGVLQLLGLLPQKLKASGVITFQNNGSDLTSHLSGTANWNISSQEAHTGKSMIRLVDRLRLLFVRAPWDFKNAFVEAVYRLANHAVQFGRLCEAGVSTLLVTAGENEGESHVMCQVAHRRGVRTCNYMNGAKARESQNEHTLFDKWFMPDESTRNLVLSYCNVRPDQVPVTGHLLEELAFTYRYKNVLTPLPTRVQSTKVIGVFTSPLFVKEQEEVFALLEWYIAERPEVNVCIKRHPSENRQLKFKSKRITEVRGVDTASPVEELFDLILLSGVTISFSSTVSMQTAWFGVPAINYEETPESRLPYVDEKTIFHANSPVRLAELLGDFLINGRQVPQRTTGLSASDEICRMITAGNT